MVEEGLWSVKHLALVIKERVRICDSFMLESLIFLNDIYNMSGR